MIINKNIPYVNYKNTFIWGQNNTPFSFRDSLDDVYFREYGKLTRRPLNWRDECVRTAKLIYEESKGEPIRVFFSGGMDSNVVAESFRLAGVPFSVVTIVFGDNWNWHDIKFAVDWCEAYSVKQILLKCDVVKFWESGDFFDIGYPVQARSPQYCVHLWGMDQIDGFVIIGLGEADLLRKRKGDPLCYDMDTEHLRVWERHLIIRNRDGAGSFFKYTPELKVSQLLDDGIIEWANDLSRGRLLKDYKNELYQAHFPNLVTRPFINSRFGDNYTDYNGCEFLPQKAVDAEDSAREELMRHFERHNQEIGVEYNTQMYNLLTEELFKDFIGKRTSGLLI